MKRLDCFVGFRQPLKFASSKYRRTPIAPSGMQGREFDDASSEAPSVRSRSGRAPIGLSAAASRGFRVFAFANTNDSRMQEPLDPGHLPHYRPFPLPRHSLRHPRRSRQAVSLPHHHLCQMAAFLRLFLLRQDPRAWNLQGEILLNKLRPQEHQIELDSQ